MSDFFLFFLSPRSTEEDVKWHTLRRQRGRVDEDERSELRTLNNKKELYKVLYITHHLIVERPRSLGFPSLSQIHLPK